jgi:DNA-binding transcriptional LysR family regulator
VRVDLDLSNRSVDLLEEGFDLAIRIGAVNSEDVVVKPLCLYRMVICAAPAYLARYGEPSSPEALREHRCLSNGVWNRRNEWKLPGEAGEMSWQRDPVLRCNDGQGLRMAAIAGAGLLLQPEILVREELANGTLVRIMQPFTPRPRPVNLVYRQDSRPLPKLTRYIEHLHHEITQWVAA